jgi:hypothetical protein
VAAVQCPGAIEGRAGGPQPPAQRSRGNVAHGGPHPRLLPDGDGRHHAEWGHPPEGRRAFILYASGNRDETQFTEPDRFDIRRTEAKKHLAFGKGIHFCVGAPLAKLEGRIAFEQLLRRLPGLRLRTDEAPVHRPYFMLRVFEHLPIAWDVPA